MRWLSRVLVLVLLPSVAVAITPTFAVAAVTRISADGIGARAVFSSVDQVDGHSVRTETQVFVSVPGDGHPLVGVTVAQVDTRSGAVAFAGTGQTEAFDLSVGPKLDSFHLTGTLSVPSSKDDQTRIVDLNVVWKATGAAEPLDASGVGVIETGELSKDSYSGTLRPMRADAVVRVADPASPTRTITANVGDADAISWDTSASARLMIRGTKSSATPSISSPTIAAAATTTGGYWTGYWTWNSQTQSWYWTWVWVP